jgi:tetratricopeptide (TPR) repeat protein
VSVSVERARQAYISARPVLDRLLHSPQSVGAPASVDAVSAWAAISSVLQPLVPEAPASDAKALVAALRQKGLCTLEEAHTLIDAHALAARGATDVASPAGELPRQVLVRADQTLDRILRTADDAASAVPLQSEYSRAAASSSSLSSSSAAAPATSDAARTASNATVNDANPSPRTDGRNNRLIVAFSLVSVLAAVIAVVLFNFVGRKDPMEQGITAYQAGQRVAARIAFEEAMVKDPADARPLIYLGRLAREEGDLAQARRLLEQAVQRAPDNALTHRELASALLADGQPELARRFYTRALTIEPTDRLAQGFLGCALARLGRVDEARRWLERAGPGDWVACANAVPAAPIPLPPVR